MSETNIDYKPRLSAWTALLLLIGMGVLFFSIQTVKNWIENQPERKERPQIIALPFVETLPLVLSDNVVKLQAGGFVSAKTTANITPQVSGKILHLSPHLVVGETVAKGEVLAQLGTTDYRVALINAQSTLKNAQAGVLSAKATLSGAKASLASATANLSSAKSSYEQAEGQSRQAARDVKSLGLKATRLNLKKPQLAAAKAAVDNAHANINSAKAQVDSANAALESAKAQVSSAKAQVELAQTNLNRTTITAPFNAIVQASDVAVGEIANNATIIASLAATDVYTVKLTVDSQVMKLISLGNNVTLADDVYDKVYDATLSRFAAGFDEKNRTIAAYVDIKKPVNAKHPLLLNSYLHAVIQGNTVANSAIIPNSAIVNNNYVWGKKADNTIVKIPVTVIQRSASESLVTFKQVTATVIISRPKDGFIEGQKVTTNSATVNNKKAKGRSQSGNQQQGATINPTDGKAKPSANQ